MSDSSGGRGVKKTLDDERFGTLSQFQISGGFWHCLQPPTARRWFKSIRIKKIKSLWHKTNRNQNGRYISPSANHHSYCRRGGGFSPPTSSSFLVSEYTLREHLRAWMRGGGNFPCLIHLENQAERERVDEGKERGSKTGMGHGSDRFHSFSKR